jgi:hypothetical protein
MINLDNDNMDYILEEHQYQPIQAKLETELNITLGNEVGGDNEVEPYLKWIRRVIYNAIYTKNRTNSRRIMEYRIATDFHGESYPLSAREGLWYAMLTQVDYSLQDDGDLDTLTSNSRIICEESLNYLKSCGLVTERKITQRISDDDYRNGY